MKILDVQHSAVSFTVPSNACDCHVHVFGPVSQFPYWSGRSYLPGDAPVEQLLALQRALHLQRVVIVHPSPYGTDNRCSIDAAQRINAGAVASIASTARVVAVIDPAAISEAELKAMHAAGVRGVRVNLESAGQHDPKVAQRLLEDAAARVAHLGWHVQTYTRLPVIVELAEVIARLPVPLVIDHFGRVSAAKGVAQPGFDVMVDLVRRGNTWVKLSAPHRISTAPDCADVEPIVRALVDANPDHMLWGTDWPHPGGHPVIARSPDVIEPFNPIDDGNALNRFARWVGDAAHLRKILVDNPAQLYGF